MFFKDDLQGIFKSAGVEASAAALAEAKHAQPVTEDISSSNEPDWCRGPLKSRPHTCACRLKRDSFSVNAVGAVQAWSHQSIYK